MTRKKNGGCIQSIGTHNNGHLDTMHGAKEENTHCDGSLLHMKDASSSLRDEKGESCTEEDSDKPEKTCRLLQLLSRLNWKNVITMFYLWAAYMLTSMCFSLMTPFFPNEVDNKCRISIGVESRGRESGHPLRLLRLNILCLEESKLVFAPPPPPPPSQIIFLY